MEFNSVSIDRKVNLVLVNEDGFKCLYEGQVVYQSNCNNVIVPSKGTLELDGLIHEGKTFKGFLRGKGNDTLLLSLQSDTDDIQAVYDVVKDNHINVVDRQLSRVGVEVLIFE